MPDASDPDLLAALRADLAAAPYSVDGLERAWGPVAAAALGRDDVEPALAALDRRPPSAAGVLGRLLVLGDAVPLPEVDRALPALGAAGAVRLGLLSVSDGRARALVDLRPVAVADDSGVASWWLASDPAGAAVGGELPEDHVLGAGAASLTLARIAVPADGADVLDLGTGSGVQALVAGSAARRVVGTDVSPRALGFAAFNAALNGRAIDLRLGPLWAPVAGERFGRIVTNPPFVITPRGDARVPEHVYRDGGLPGDGLVEAVVRGAGDHLLPGGIAQLLGNWEVRGDEGAARERVLGWAAGLDVWVVERDLLDPAEYAETWVRDGGVPAGGPRFRELVRAWLDDFAARGVTAVGAGWVTLRAPADGTPTLRRFEHLDEPTGTGVGAAVLRALAAHDGLRGLDDAALAGQRLRVRADVTEHRHLWPGASDPTVIELRQGAGFARTSRVGTATAAVVGACDGDLPVGRLIAAVARLLDEDPDAVAGTVLPELRRLVFEGFLDLPERPAG